MNKKMRSLIAILLTLVISASLIPSVSFSFAEETLVSNTDELTDTQKNSINMLNWLAYLTQQINSSSNNRLYLEEVYSLIVNEIYPNAVDSHTQDRLKGIRQALLRYRMVEVKRERIEYLYEQNKADAIRSAVPSPLSVMNIVQSGNWVKMVASAVAMAVNSVASYQSAAAQAEMQYLQDGWELTDEADSVFYSLRSDAFDYMIDIVREYSLHGNLTLNELAVDEFVQWKNNPNVVRRIQFLESNEERYSAFGSYWLLLASSYYEVEDYAKCLDAIHRYEALNFHIFRKDIEYANLLPMVIVASENVLSEEEYIKQAEHYTEIILNNINTDNWSLRYFAAQIYVYLYTKTENTEYLKKAYAITLDNVNYLVDKQNILNATYLAKVKEATIPSGSTKDQETQIKNYNKLLKETRKKELIPVYEPLLVNCDLLFALAEKLDISATEKKHIDNLLHPNNTNLFLNDTLDNSYRFDNLLSVDEALIENITFNGKELKLAASLITDHALITVTVTNAEGEATTFTDWKVEKVDRKTEGVLSTFAATLKSTTAEKIQYEEGMTVNLSIQHYTGYETADSIDVLYTVQKAKNEWYEHIAIWNSDFTFEQVK